MDILADEVYVPRFGWLSRPLVVFRPGSGSPMIAPNNHRRQRKRGKTDYFSSDNWRVKKRWFCLFLSKEMIQLSAVFRATDRDDPGCSNPSPCSIVITAWEEKKLRHSCTRISSKSRGHQLNNIFPYAYGYWPTGMRRPTCQPRKKGIQSGDAYLIDRFHQPTTLQGNNPLLHVDIEGYDTSTEKWHYWRCLEPQYTPQRTQPSALTAFSLTSRNQTVEMLRRWILGMTFSAHATFFLFWPEE